MINLLNCSKKEFIEIIRNEEVVCFCAGNELYRICEEFPQIVGKIKYVADNKKFGTNISLGEKSVPVISFEDKEINDKKYIGVISTISYADYIVRQLDDLDKYDGMTVYIPFFLESDEECSFVFQEKSEQIIPKKIHYCWFGNNKMPDQFKRNIETWEKYCPNYEIIRWDESNYNVEKNLYMKQAYEAKKWGFVPDYARLDIINKHGGIYLDTDVELIKPLDALLGFNMFCGFECKDYVAFGLGFGGVANNKILFEMMLQYEHMQFKNLDGTLNQVASPVYQTEILQKHGLKCNGEFQIIDGCAVFPKEFFAPIDSFGIGSPSEKSFSIHQYAATWFDSSMQQQKNRMLEIISFVKKRMQCKM